MKLYIIDVTTVAGPRHYVAETIGELIANMPANHPATGVRVENRRPTVAEAQQIHEAHQRHVRFADIVKQALDREARSK
jgi:hypothetical protein